jgi:hypothetical protein
MRISVREQGSFHQFRAFFYLISMYFLFYLSNKNIKYTQYNILLPNYYSIALQYKQCINYYFYQIKSLNIMKTQARSKKQEARSKKQEARSKKQEARSKKQEARSNI